MTGIAVEAEFAVGHGFADGGADIEVERLAEGAGLFGAVEDGDLLDRLGQRLDEGVQREGTVEADLDDADLLALLGQVLDGFLNGVGAGTHDDDDPLGIGGADVVDQLVLAAGELGELVHLFLDDLDAGRVVLVDGFAPLEVDVRVLGGAAHDRTVGERPRARWALTSSSSIMARMSSKVSSSTFWTSCEVRKPSKKCRNGPRAQGGGLGDQGKVHDFLDVVGAEHGPAGGAAGHDVGVVAEDVESAWAADGAGRNMEDRGGQFAGDLVHVGDHQQQTLAGGKGGGQGAGLQGAVDGAGGAAFGLHLGHQRDGPPDVLLARGALGVGDLPHDRDGVIG